MRLTCFYLISALGLSIGLVEVRLEKETRKQEQLVSEILYLTDQSIRQTGVLLSILRDHTANFKKLRRHKEAVLVELRDTYNDISALHLQYKAKPIIDDQGVNPVVLNHLHSVLKGADALWRQTNAVWRNEYIPREYANPMPMIRDAQLQYPVGKTIKGKLDLFLPTNDEHLFTQVIVDGNIIVNPRFPLHVQQKSNDFELTIRNPVTLEETVFRNIDK